MAFLARKNYANISIKFVKKIFFFADVWQNLFFRSGYTAWRDGVKPSTILNDLCAKDERGKPSYRENGCYIDECCPAKKDTLRRGILRLDMYEFSLL